jgi:putative endonuclease
MPFWVYMMTNTSKHPVYTGFTNDLQRRVWEHKNKIEEGYTKQYNLTRLVHFEEFVLPGGAIAREKEIKGWVRRKKIALIECTNPRWDDLARGWGEQFKPPQNQGPSVWRVDRK